MPSFMGQVVIITGAGSGIGRATAIKLASLGAELAMADISPPALQETLVACQETSTSTSTSASEAHLISLLDVGISGTCNDFVDKVVARYGRIDHVFNCAGINPTKLDTATVSDDYWDKLLDTNLKSVFNFTRACLPHMGAGASFVNVSSVAGLYPVPQVAVYCATKFAVIGFSKSVAMEVGSRGIRVNVIAPGTTETPTNMAVRAGNEALESTAHSIGLKRIGTTDEIADVAVFLFSQESRYMNGSVVEVHGGVGLAG